MRWAAVAAWGLPCALFLGWLFAAKHHALETHQITSDIFAYHRAVANTLDGRFMADLALPNLLANHSYLLLLAFVPLYALWSSPVWLLASSIVAHGASAVLVGLLAARASGSRPAGFALGAAWLLNPFVTEFVLMPVYGFQPDVLAPPFLFGALLAMLSGRWGWACAALTLLAAVKEEFSLLAVGVALWLTTMAFVGPWLADRLGKAGRLLAPPALTTAPLGPSLWLVAWAMVCAVASFAIMAQAKAEAFSFAPTVSSIGLGDALQPASIVKAIGGVWGHAAAFGYIPVLLGPEFSLVLGPLRMAASAQAYPPHLDALALAKGFSWSSVTPSILLFWAAIVGLGRIREVTINPLFPALLPLAASLWLVAMPGDYPAALRETLGKSLSGEWARESSAQAQLRADLRLALAAIPTPAERTTARLVVSPRILMAAADHDAVTPGFIQHLRPTLIADIDAALILNDDAESLTMIANHPEFVVCRQTATVRVLVRGRCPALSPSRTGASPTP